MADDIDGENMASHNQGSKNPAGPAGLFKRPRVRGHAGRDQDVLTGPGPGSSRPSPAQGAERIPEPTPAVESVSSLSPGSLARAISELPDYDETLSELGDNQTEQISTPGVE